jgi:hypothetical protein
MSIARPAGVCPLFRLVAFSARPVCSAGLVIQGVARGVALYVQHHRAAVLTLMREQPSLLRVLTVLPGLDFTARFVATLCGLVRLILNACVAC